MASSSNGFSKKSMAPIFMASTASGTSPCPVMTITGMSRLNFFSRLSRSMPLTSGILTSVITQPAWICGRTSRKALALSYVRTLSRAVRSRNASDCRTASSSSITCTMTSDGIADFLPVDRAQREAKDRAAGRIGLHPDVAAMRLDDGARDRQADPHAMPLGGEERLEQLRSRLFRNAVSGVGHADGDHAVLAGSGGHDELAPGRLLHGLDRVAHEVEQHLLDLHLVGEHKLDRRIELELDAYAVILRADQGQGAGLLDQLAEILDAALGLAAGDEIAQPADDLPGAQRLFPRLVHRVVHHDGALVGGAFEQAPRAFQVVGNGGQWLIELVRQGRGHLAHGGEPRDVDELRLQLLQAGLGLLPLRQVANEAGEETLVARPHLADRKLDRKRRPVLALAHHHPADADDAA